MIDREASLYKLITSLAIASLLFFSSSGIGFNHSAFGASSSNIVLRTSMKDLHIVIPKLKAGDLVLLMGDNVYAKQKAQSMVPAGVKVQITYQYDSYTNLAAALLSMPAGVGMVDYDYERGPLCPEFTNNELTSIGYFDKAEAAVHAYNARTGGTAVLQVDTPMGELYYSHWDWHLASQHIDLMNVQMQSFTTKPSLSLPLITMLLNSRANGLSIELSTAQMQPGAGTPLQNAYIVQNADPRANPFFIHHAGTLDYTNLMTFLNLLRP